MGKTKTAEKQGKKQKGSLIPEGKTSGYKLGTIVTDGITGVKGMLTHLVMCLGGNRYYVFQPRGINPKTLQPVKTTWIEEARVEGGVNVLYDAPVHILGRKGEDLGSGFKGAVTSLVYHINGCLHVSLKPKGIRPDDGATIDEHDFDIRRVKIEGIEPMTDEQIKEDIVKKPSPEPLPPKAFSGMPSEMADLQD